MPDPAMTLDADEALHVYDYARTRADIERDRFPGIDPAVLTLAEEIWRAKRSRHRDLFGHPFARVFIVGPRLLVLHPRAALQETGIAPC